MFRFIMLNRAVLAISLLPLLLGGVTYLFWRPDTVYFISCLNELSIYRLLEPLRNYTANLYPYLPEWLVYSLPNGLWAFSYAFVITFLWSGEKTRVKYFWFTTVPLVGLGYEFLQFRGVLYGTFCIIDLSLCSVGIAAGALFGYIIKKRRKGNAKT